MRCSSRFASHWIAGLSLTASIAHAAIVNAPVPTSAYITVGGFDWAWAFPISPDGAFGQGSASPQYRIDLSYQSQFGWRLPSAAELLLAPDAVDFLFAGANVRLGTDLDPTTGAFFEFSGVTGNRPNQDGACATPYFSTFYRECDWYNGRGLTSADWWNPDKSYGSGPGRQLASTDTLVIRASSIVSAVPEPASLPLTGLSLAMLAAVRFFGCSRGYGTRTRYQRLKKAAP